MKIIPFLFTFFLSLIGLYSIDFQLHSHTITHLFSMTHALAGNIDITWDQYHLYSPYHHLYHFFMFYFLKIFFLMGVEDSFFVLFIYQSLWISFFVYVLRLFTNELNLNIKDKTLFIGSFLIFSPYLGWMVLAVENNISLYGIFFYFLYVLIYKNDLKSILLAGLLLGFSYGLSSIMYTQLLIFILALMLGIFIKQIRDFCFKYIKIFTISIVSYISLFFLFTLFSTGEHFKSQFSVTMKHMLGFSSGVDKTYNFEFLSSAHLDSILLGFKRLHFYDVYLDKSVGVLIFIISLLIFVFIISKVKQLEPIKWVVAFGVFFFGAQAIKFEPYVGEKWDLFLMCFVLLIWFVIEKLSFTLQKTVKSLLVIKIAISFIIISNSIYENKSTLNKILNKAFEDNWYHSDIKEFKSLILPKSMISYEVFFRTRYRNFLHSTYIEHKTDTGVILLSYTNKPEHFLAGNYHYFKFDPNKNSDLIYDFDEIYNRNDTFAISD